MTRQDKIVKTSIIGIVVNLILVAFKATVGILSNSIAITLDAVNNLTDALSSIITIIGTKLAGKSPDKSHPYGYGRIEYFTAIIISAIVLWAGFTSLMESLPKIIYPDVTTYTPVSLLIIAVAVVVKFLLGRYVKGVGEKINSQALVASGSDAFFDSIISLSTLVGALVSIFFNISIEGILGAIISVVILKAGFDILRETVDSMLGERINKELSIKIKETIREFDHVYGAYDLSIHNYGPESMIGSVHVEVDDTLSAPEMHILTRQITEKVYEDFSIVLTVGIYARNDKYKFIRDDVETIAGQYDEVLEVHGFFVYEKKRLVTFDMIVDFDADREHIKNEIKSKLKAKHSDFGFEIIDDYDISD